MHQLARILEMFDELGVSRERLQELFRSGLLSDLFSADQGKSIDRNIFRRVLGFKPKGVEVLVGNVTDKNKFVHTLQTESDFQLCTPEVLEMVNSSDLVLNSEPNHRKVLFIVSGQQIGFTSEYTGTTFIDRLAQHHMYAPVDVKATISAITNPDKPRIPKEKVLTFAHNPIFVNPRDSNFFTLKISKASPMMVGVEKSRYDFSPDHLWVVGMREWF